MAWNCNLSSGLKLDTAGTAFLHRGLYLLSQRLLLLFLFFFLEQFSEKHLHRDVPKETTLTSQLSWRRFLESKFRLAQIMGGKQRRPR